MSFNDYLFLIIKHESYDVKAQKLEFLVFPKTPIFHNRIKVNAQVQTLKRRVQCIHGAGALKPYSL